MLTTWLGKNSEKDISLGPSVLQSQIVYVFEHPVFPQKETSLYVDIRLLALSHSIFHWGATLTTWLGKQ